ADAAIEEFQAPLQANAIPERAMNAIGYRLMGQKKFADAIKVFQLNVKRFPDSANVYDSLGEAYMNNNDKPAAIQNYQKSLQLNPGNTNATEMLKKLKE
ncbi:MAG TPA: tetratricopeptide repeat protein, partial [Terriglobales bacterium]